MRSSVIKGDLLMDNALDAVGDVYMVDPYSLDVVDVLLNSYKSANSADQRMQDDRMLALKAFWTDLPYWFDPAASERGRRVMCSRTDQVIIGCVSGALPIMMACPQTMMLLSCGSKETQLLSPTFKGMMHDAYGDGDSVTFQNSILLLVDATFAMMVDALLYMLSYCSSSNDKKYYFNDGHTLFGGHLSRGSAGWEKLVRIRAYFSIIRRRAMSLFGKHDRWEYEKYGLPLSQAYCTLMMSVFTTAILNSLGNCSAEDEKAALMTWSAQKCLKLNFNLLILFLQSICQPYTRIRDKQARLYMGTQL